jgi:hypothetical protein
MQRFFLVLFLGIGLVVEASGTGIEMTDETWVTFNDWAQSHFDSIFESHFDDTGQWPPE